MMRWEKVGRVSMCKRIMKSESLKMVMCLSFKIGTFGKYQMHFSQEFIDQYKKAYSFPKKEMFLSAAENCRTVIL